MATKVTIQGRGILITATVLDEALPHLIKLTQEYLDVTETAAPVSLASVDASVGTSMDVKSVVSGTTEDRVKAILRDYAAGELLNRVGWTSFSDKILLLACWAEAKGQVVPWKREDIEGAFAQAKEKPPANFGRDVGSAIKAGLIHAQTARTYVVTRSGWNKVGDVLNT